jgi:hypothetical protein
MSITKQMMDKLLSVGFRFEEFEENLDGPGNVFFYNGVEHTIGGGPDLQMCLYKLVLKVSRYLKENNIQY